MEDTKPVGKAVYKAITAVQGEMAAIGISKNSKNQQQGFMFRGIDAVYNALAPLLAKHKLCIIPRCQSRVQTERESRQGGALFSVVLDVEYDVISGEDGSCHVARLLSEAMDSADKATNKAMSAAYKYLCLQMFCIPTEGESPDADEQSHDVKGKSGASADQRGVDGEMLFVGKVKSIVPTSSPKFVTIHTFDDRRLGTGDQHLIDVAAEVMKTGEDVRFHYIPNGRFTDLTGIDRRPPAAKQVPAARSGPVPAAAAGGKPDPHQIGGIAPSAGHLVAVGVIESQLPVNSTGYTAWTLEGHQNDDASYKKFASKDPAIIALMVDNMKTKCRVRVEYLPAKKAGMANMIFGVRPEPLDEIPF